MTANKLKIAGAAAAVVLVGAAALTLHQQGGLLPASGPATRDAAADAAPAQPPKSATGSHKGGDKPLWRSLTPAQQADLQARYDTLEARIQVDTHPASVEVRRRPAD